MLTEPARLCSMVEACENLRPEQRASLWVGMPKSAKPLGKDSDAATGPSQARIRALGKIAFAPAQPRCLDGYAVAYRIASQHRVGGAK